MELLTLDEVRERWAKEYADLPEAADFVRLPRWRASTFRIRKCQQNLGLAFHSSFLSVLRRYNFGSFTLGTFSFS